MVGVEDFPSGYRFLPTDEELVVHYLEKKINNEPLPTNFMIDVNIYQQNPDNLAQMFRKYPRGEGWYFFTPRERKYPNGFRPKRSAANGYWKATGADKAIVKPGTDIIVGRKQSLVFYVGKAPKGVKTNWIMYEYKLLNSPKPAPDAENKMKLDDWVLCRINKNVARERKEAAPSNAMYADEGSAPVEEEMINPSAAAAAAAPDAGQEIMPTENKDYYEIFHRYGTEDDTYGSYGNMLGDDMFTPSSRNSLVYEFPLPDSFHEHFLLKDEHYSGLLDENDSGLLKHDGPFHLDSQKQKQIQPQIDTKPKNSAPEWIQRDDYPEGDL